MKIYTDVLPQELIDECGNQIQTMATQRVWGPSVFNWVDDIKSSSCGEVLAVYIPADLVIKLNDALRETYFSSYKQTKKLIYQFYVWNKLSSIDMHLDTKYTIGASIYLNKTWNTNLGGLFVWEDKKTDHALKVLCPKQNMMVINDIDEKHGVTLVSPYISMPRLSIQIFGTA